MQLLIQVLQTLSSEENIINQFCLDPVQAYCTNIQIVKKSDDKECLEEIHCKANVSDFY